MENNFLTISKTSLVIMLKIHYLCSQCVLIIPIIIDCIEILEYYLLQKN